MARPPKYKGAETCAIVAECKRQGWPEAWVATKLGVAQSTYFEWRAEKPELAEAHAQGQLEYRENLLGIVQRDAASDSKTSVSSARWLLEKSEPEFGRAGPQVVVFANEENKIPKVDPKRAQELLRSLRTIRGGKA